MGSKEDPGIPGGAEGNEESGESRCLFPPGSDNSVSILASTEFWACEGIRDFYPPGSNRSPNTATRGPRRGINRPSKVTSNSGSLVELNLPPLGVRYHLPFSGRVECGIISLGRTIGQDPEAHGIR